jgi:hypothetical protein
MNSHKNSRQLPPKLRFTHLRKLTASPPNEESDDPFHPKIFFHIPIVKFWIHSLAYILFLAFQTYHLKIDFYVFMCITKICAFNHAGKQNFVV